MIRALLFYGFLLAGVVTVFVVLPLTKRFGGSL
jgi:hypothetical protein